MIKGIGPGQGVRIETGQARGASGSDAVARTEAAKPTESLEQSISTLMPLVNAGPPVDSDKIARIKQQIANGTYKIDPDLIADKMMEMDLPEKPAQ